MLHEELSSGGEEGHGTRFRGRRQPAPSIGPGTVLSDMIASNKSRNVELATVFRQAAQSSIVLARTTLSRQVRRPLPTTKTEFVFINSGRPALCCDEIISLPANMSQRLPVG